MKAPAIMITGGRTCEKNQIKERCRPSSRQRPNRSRRRTWQTEDDDLLALDILGDVDLFGRKSEIKFDTWDLVPCFDRSHLLVRFSCLTIRVENYEKGIEDVVAAPRLHGACFSSAFHSCV